eukprot:gene19022-25614_t
MLASTSRFTQRVPTAVPMHPIAVPRALNSKAARGSKVLQPIRIEAVELASVCSSAIGRRSVVTAAKKDAAASDSTPSTAADLKIEVTSDNLSTTRRQLTVVVPPAMVGECFEATVTNLRKVGKIPLSMVISNVGGPTKFKLTVIEEILMKVMPLVMGEVKEPVIPESEQITSDMKALVASFDPKKSVTFEVTFDTAPPVTWTKPYKDIEVTIRDSGDFATDQAAMEDLIRQYQKEKAQQRVVTGRGVAMGDVCIMKLRVRSPGTGVPLPGFDEDRSSLDTEVDPLNLTQGMLGMTVGEKRTFPITFPDDYKVELWKGQTYDATVELNEIFSWVMPELNDEFVKAGFEGKFESVEEMKKALLATTAMLRVQALDKQLEEEVLNALVACIEVDEVPEGMLIEMGSSQFRASLMQMIDDILSAVPGIEVDDVAEGMLIEMEASQFCASLMQMIAGVSTCLCYALVALFLSYIISAVPGIEVDEVPQGMLVEIGSSQFRASLMQMIADVDEVPERMLVEIGSSQFRASLMQMIDDILSAVPGIEVDEVAEGMLIEMEASQFCDSLMQMIDDVDEVLEGMLVQRIIKQEDLDKLATEEKAEEFIMARKSDLEDLVKFNLVVDEIFANENLTIDEKDIETEFTERSKQYKSQKMDYEPTMLREQIMDTFKHVQVIEWLKDNLKRTVIPYERKEEEAKV